MAARRPLSAIGALVAVSVMVLAAVAYDGASATHNLLRQQRVEQIDGFQTLYACLAQGFRRAVPEGARVLLRTEAPDDEAYQRIIESTYPDYQFVSRREDADLIVRVRPRDRCRPQITISVIS